MAIASTRHYTPIGCNLEPLGNRFVRIVDNWPTSIATLEGPQSMDIHFNDHDVLVLAPAQPANVTCMMGFGGTTDAAVTVTPIVDQCDMSVNIEAG